MSDLGEIPDPKDRPKEVEGEPLVENPPRLMPDLRGEATEEGRDPEEVDPVREDEGRLRHESGEPGYIER